MNLTINPADNAPNWYATLKKPFFAPPSWLFGPVWTVLYVLIAIAFIRTIQLWRQEQLSTQFLSIFVLNLLSNLAFSPLQFGLQNNLLALIDILVVLATLIYLVWQTRGQQQLIFYLLLPYLIWVAFASVLQVSITVLNF